MIKRLIFDVDNTLITNVSFREAIGKTLKDLNIYSEENLDNFFKGIGDYESLYNSYNYIDYKNHMEKYMNVTIPDNFFDVFFYYLKDVVPEYNERLMGAIDNLSKKYELVILSNFFSVSQMNRLNTMGIGKYFSEIYGEDVIKPNIEAYLKACGLHKPIECVMIGDSLYLDVECAINNGLNAIFVNTKGIPTDDLDYVVVDKVEDINEDIINKIME